MSERGTARGEGEEDREVKPVQPGQEATSRAQSTVHKVDAEKENPLSAQAQAQQVGEDWQREPQRAVRVPRAQSARLDRSPGDLADSEHRVRWSILADHGADMNG